MTIPEFEKGNTVYITTTFSDDENTVVEPDNKQGFIEITDIDTQEVVVQRTTMTNLSDTQYRYNWDTDESMTVGEYEVEASGTISGDDVVNRDKVRLVDIIDTSSSSSC